MAAATAMRTCMAANASNGVAYRGRGPSLSSGRAMATLPPYCQRLQQSQLHCPLPAGLCTTLPSPHRRHLHICASSAAPEAEQTPVAAAAAAAPATSILFSDVAPRWKKPYFQQRPWTLVDAGLAAFFVGTHVACLWAPSTFTWEAFEVFLGLYVVTGMLGITISYHRNLSHKSFVLPKWLEYIFAYCGVLSLQGDPIEWVSTHRHHHQHCDTDIDPHSPYGGFWFSHIVWLLDSNLLSERLDPRTNAADMLKQPYYTFLQKTYPLHALLSLALLYAWGGLPFLIWGGAVRIVWVYHITWLINSCCHVWGFQSWKTGDLSRNNWVIGILAFGEGWHNNHHAFEFSARHGLEWWQLDMTWYLILLMEKMGLATNLKLPTQEQMRRLALDPK